MKPRFELLVVGLWFLLASAIAHAADFAVLSPETWDSFVPAGKEVDAIYGDLVLRNEHLIVVIAQPAETRNANMTVKKVGACVIDFTERQSPNDQLSAYYPGGGRYRLESLEKARLLVDDKVVATPWATGSGKTITVEFVSKHVGKQADLTVRYTLADGARALQVETVHHNATRKAIELDIADAIRADRTFTFGFQAPTNCFWADDEWFRQAYGIIVPGYEVHGNGQRGTLLELVKQGASNHTVTLEPGGSLSIRRQLIVGSSRLAIEGLSRQIQGQAVRPVRITVGDPQPVGQARIVVSRDGAPYASARTDQAGTAVFLLPPGPFSAALESVDGRKQELAIPAAGEFSQAVKLAPASYVVGRITDDRGRPLPAKISFTGRSGTSSPNWGPDSGEVAVRNVYYTHNGTFRQPIAPGSYDVLVSYGPEHDVVATQLDVSPASTAELRASLKRSVDTSGWISADFHSHATPSGDNTASQLGRVLNLLCEHIEFAPCTEHNRIDTYVPHLRRLGVEHLLATCTGMELTGSPLPINHQNAFPLIHKPRTQDGGGPQISEDPVAQVERLAFWDSRSDKLVQMNHPNLPQILGDRDEDGRPDAGFERMFGFVDVIEVHPPQGVFQAPQKKPDGKREPNPAFHWLQMLNLGYRHPGVINTDSHYNYHESGFFRNFIRCSTDDPAKVDAAEIVRQSEAGHVVVSTGPFLSVTARATQGGSSGRPAIPGDDLAAPGGRVELQVRVQCPNWFEINRVQVFQNGRPVPQLNFTRRSHPQQFSTGTVQFESRIPVSLSADAHLVVATIGEGNRLGPVMGPEHGKLPPVAVANPIFVDVDGKGFQANGDLLDHPLPLAPTRSTQAK